MTREDAAPPRPTRDAHPKGHHSMNEIYDFEIEYLAKVLAWVKNVPQDETSFNMYVRAVRLEIDGTPFGILTDHGDEGWIWRKDAAQ